jgi:hypothetical protein
MNAQRWKLAEQQHNKPGYSRWYSCQKFTKPCEVEIIVKCQQYRNCIAKSVHENNKPNCFPFFFGTFYVHDFLLNIDCMEYGTALTNILPILFLYLNTVTVTTGAFEP